MNFYDLVDKTKEIFLPFGALGLFVVAFIESSFFIVPPDIILIALSLMDPSASLFYAAVTTIGSVSGAVFGYYIGVKGGRPILLKIASDEMVKKVQRLYDEYGSLAIGLAGFTPIPYKVFAISSGVFGFRLPSFIVASVIGRGARFFLEALIIMYYGEEILSFISNYFGPLTLIIGLLTIVVVYLYKKYVS